MRRVARRVDRRWLARKRTSQRGLAPEIGIAAIARERFERKREIEAELTELRLPRDPNVGESLSVEMQNRAHAMTMLRSMLADRKRREAEEAMGSLRSPDRSS